MPTKKQLDSNRSISSFDPVLGGGYFNGGANNIGAAGNWWGSEATNTSHRDRLLYNGSNLSTVRVGRYLGYYIRCVSEEKTVLDLTYMQDG